MERSEILAGNRIMTSRGKLLFHMKKTKEKRKFYSLGS